MGLLKLQNPMTLGYLASRKHGKNTETKTITSTTVPTVNKEQATTEVGGLLVVFGSVILLIFMWKTFQGVCKLLLNQRK